MKKLLKEQNTDWSVISEKVWQNGVIVFDTNVLLNLYRYNEEARDELLKLMKSFQKRLWMPYQVGLEFLANRVTVINWLHKGYEELTNQVDECKKVSLSSLMDIMQSIDILIGRNLKHFLTNSYRLSKTN